MIVRSAPAGLVQLPTQVEVYICVIRRAKLTPI